jgi:nucleoside-diphosphate-sugar epimerase
MERKTIAVTGISGYFGRLLLPLLEADDGIESILGFDCRPLSAVQPGRKLVFHEMDIREAGFEPRLKGCDTLVHLAFQVMRLPGMKQIDEVNIKAMRATCEAAARQGVKKLIFTSSVVAYGMHADNPTPLTEESSLRPNDDLYYGLAKAGNESFLDDYAQIHPGLTVTRLRPCTVIGPQAEPGMMTSLTTNPMVLVRGYNPPVQLVHEEDVASALHLAIQKDLPGVYNLVSDGPRTLTELIEMRKGRWIALPYFLVKAMMSILWRRGASLFAPEWIELSRFSLVASNARLKSAGWRPKYTTAEAFASLMASLGVPVQPTPELVEGPSTRA